jgi:uncharacterized protein YndB with AHSA1/START domain
MSRRSAHHAALVTERTFAFAPAVVFAAWADPAAKARGVAGADEWKERGTRALLDKLGTEPQRQ